MAEIILGDIVRDAETGSDHAQISLLSDLLIPVTKEGRNELGIVHYYEELAQLTRLDIAVTDTVFYGDPSASMQISATIEGNTHHIADSKIRRLMPSSPQLHKLYRDNTQVVELFTKLAEHTALITTFTDYPYSSIAYNDPRIRDIIAPAINSAKVYYILEAHRDHPSSEPWFSHEETGHVIMNPEIVYSIPENQYSIEIEGRPFVLDLSFYKGQKEELASLLNNNEASS